MTKPELLAPAGNFNCLVAAVQSGADAVYLSGKFFGARSYADNFDYAELEKAVDYCHLRNTKVYVTVNTLVSDSELSEFDSYIRFLNELGVDAVIVQDMGALNRIRVVSPQLPIHASTQMTVHNADGVSALEAYGVKRVVLARELSLENIKRIAAKTNAELEVFAHGALCMCYSGQCLMSSIIGGRSGNRGKCAQPCRLPYSINHAEKSAFYMSLKDLSTLDRLTELTSAGVTSLKIEGRMKGAAYVAAVVGVYRKYIDNPHSVETCDEELLDRIFNRGGVTDGYLTGNIGKSMFAFNKPDNPYHKSLKTLENELLENVSVEKRNLKLRAFVKIKIGELPFIAIEGNGVRIEALGTKKTEHAKRIAANAETVAFQINKTGGTPFEFSDIDVEIDDGAFVAVSELNLIRRSALEAFEKKYLLGFRRTALPNAALFTQVIPNSEAVFKGFTCEITTLQQLAAVKDRAFTLFYVPLNIINDNPKAVEAIKEKTVIVLPAIIHENEYEKIVQVVIRLVNSGFYGVMATNIALVHRFKDYRVIGSFRLNIFNSEALAFYKDAGVEAAELSPELSLKQIEKIKKSVPVQTMVYGRLPLMVTENCIVKNGSSCPCSKKNTITDRMGMVFPVINDGASCRSVVLNCKKTFMGFDTEKIKRAGASLLRIYFSDETPEECKMICDSFLNGSGYRPVDFTNGHFIKGVK